jgi:hypothetical protein
MCIPRRLPQTDRPESNPLDGKSAPNAEGLGDTLKYTGTGFGKDPNVAFGEV